MGRLDPADMRIGQVFAHAPIGTDGIWPDIAIRDLLEVVNSSAMEDGLLSQIYSNRGAVTKSLLEGGGQERQLAEKYKSYATATRDCWPRISSVLRSMSEKYASEARRSDKQAELEEDLGR